MCLFRVGVPKSTATCHCPALFQRGCLIKTAKSWAEWFNDAALIYWRNVGNLYIKKTHIRFISKCSALGFRQVLSVIFHKLIELSPLGLFSDIAKCPHLHLKLSRSQRNSFTGSSHPPRPHLSLLIFCALFLAPFSSQVSSYQTCEALVSFSSSWSPDSAPCSCLS